MLGVAIATVIRLAGQHVLFQAAAIMLGTFVLEDAATVLVAMWAETGGIAISLALVSLYSGIVLGDLGLYGLGRLPARLPALYRAVGELRVRQGQAWLGQRRRRVFTVVFVSRFLPGMRLPTFMACGFLAADFRQFAMAAIVATLIWTSLLFGISLRIGKLLIEHFGAWRWAGAVGFAVAVVVLGLAAGSIRRRQQAAGSRASKQ
jgi:membrane protein DedA with SNARE-associated domain